MYLCIRAIVVPLVLWIGRGSAVVPRSHLEGAMMRSNLYGADHAKFAIICTRVLRPYVSLEILFV